MELIAKTVEAGGKLADAIEKGIEYLKNTEYYKSKGTKGQELLEKQIRDNYKNPEKEVELPKVITDEISESTKLTHDAIDKDREKLGLEKLKKDQWAL